jgi:RHS repeat-associated protein
LGYDNDGLLTSLNGLTIARHPLHGLPTQVSNSKLNQTMEYNGYGESKGRTTTVNNKRSYDYGLTYNLIGQITGKTETLADGTNNTFVYGYDDKRRLISVLKNNIQIESYDYDANGNRELKSSAWSGIIDQAATFNIADQQQSDGATQFEYDTNGRLSKKLSPIDGGTAIEEYSYSSQGRLLSVVFKELDTSTTVETTLKTITYKHNALGNRVAKLVDGSVVEKYLWLDKTTLLATYDQNDNLKQRFEYGLSHTPVKFTQNSTTYYITSDHLGSPRTITDESGSVIKALDYDSFGSVVSDSNESFEIPFGFAGGLKDSDTQLLRFGYRDYDPQIGRWTARDPIGFAGGDTNLYGYVTSDPINWIDPTGEVGVIAAAIYVGVTTLGILILTDMAQTGMEGARAIEKNNMAEALGEKTLNSEQLKVAENKRDVLKLIDPMNGLVTAMPKGVSSIKLIYLKLVKLLGSDVADSIMDLWGVSADENNCPN